MPMLLCLDRTLKVLNLPIYIYIYRRIKVLMVCDGFHHFIVHFVRL